MNVGQKDNTINMNGESDKHLQVHEKSFLPLQDYSVNELRNLCRICANPNERIIGIYSEEGLSNELSNKMNLYLPITVSENDTLPLQCCWSCASTILAWHELVVVSVETDRRLRGILHVDDNKSESTSIYENFEATASPLVPDERSVEVNPTSEHLPSGDSNKQEPLTCHSCEKTFIRRSDLLKHTKQQHINEKNRKRRCRDDIQYKIFCDICYAGFTRRSDMRKHKSIQHRNISKQEEEETTSETSASCRICNSEFKQMSQLKEHFKTDHQHNKLRVRRPKFAIVPEHFCDICGKGFTRKFDMQKHKKLKHHNEIETGTEATVPQAKSQLLDRCKITIEANKCFYKCEVCNRIFQQAYNFLRHQTVHTGVRAYFCHICGKDFRVSSGLHRHITEHHYRIKKYSCDLCDKSFAAKATRDEHRNIHTNNRPFVCSVCGKTFKQKASLHTHTLFHSDNYRFSCSVCGKKYRRASELKIHTWLHTGHKPYQCTMCPSKFRLTQDLKRHLKIHDKLNECICHECGAKFSQERHLKNHSKNRHKESFIV